MTCAYCGGADTYGIGKCSDCHCLVKRCRMLYERLIAPKCCFCNSETTKILCKSCKSIILPKSFLMNQIKEVHTLWVNYEQEQFKSCTNDNSTNCPKTYTNESKSTLSKSKNTDSGKNVLKTIHKIFLKHINYLINDEVMGYEAELQDLFNSSGFFKLINFDDLNKEELTNYENKFISLSQHINQIKIKNFDLLHYKINCVILELSIQFEMNHKRLILEDSIEFV